jgi:hypothetical protein
MITQHLSLQGSGSSLKSILAAMSCSLASGLAVGTNQETTISAYLVVELRLLLGGMGPQALQ